MAHDYESGYARIQSLREEFESGKHRDINEATTRLRFVDAILFECLDWDKNENTIPEKHSSNIGFADYALHIESCCFLIVEAKREGDSFVLPVGSQRSTQMRVDSVMSLGDGIKKAMEQCASYMLNEGSPFGVVCNGHQLVAFTSSPSVGISWRKGNALIFDSIKAMAVDFIHLWNNLSKSAISKFNLQKTLSKKHFSPPCAKRSATIDNYDKRKNRNDFQAELQILGDLVFGGSMFWDREAFQEHCYCPAGALPQYSSATKRFLQDRYPQFFQTTAATPHLEPAVGKKGPASALMNMTNVLKPILLLGDVGVGKTTFIEHLFLVDWKDRRNDIIVLRIDFGDNPSRAEDVPHTTAQRIEHSLLDDYNIDIREDSFVRAVYHSELSRFDKSPSGRLKSIDPAAHAREEISYINQLQSSFDRNFKAIFSHLVKGRKKMVVIVFDNVDQRDADLQRAAFTQAQIASSNWDVFVIVSMRPETFVRSKIHGAASGYHERAFYISPPRFDLLMQKRITAARMLLSGKAPVNIGAKAVNLSLTSVTEYLEVMEHSFANDSNLLAVCYDLSGGNMRLALDYIVAFMSCGHVDAKKILEQWHSPNKYIIPFHEFMRGVMFSDREYYSGNTEQSYVINVFDCMSDDPKESFGLLSFLAMLSGGEGDFVRLADCHQRLTNIGFAPEQIDWITQRAFDRRLVETNQKTNLDFTHVRISPTGSVYYAKLVRTFVYVDAVCIDTPICDKNTISKIVMSDRLDARATRSRAFIQYLSSVFASSPRLQSELNWNQISSEILNDIARAEASYARKKSHG